MLKHGLRSVDYGQRLAMQQESWNAEKEMKSIEKNR
jgi:hypothetical protein